MYNNYVDFNNFIDGIMKVLHISKKKFSRNDIITTYIEKRGQILFLINGEAELVRYDSDGNKNIVESFSNNDIFGEFFYSVNNNNELQVVATEECELLIFNYDDLISKDIPKGQNYCEIITIMLSIISNKIVEMNNRIEVLTKRTIREKLLAYFESIYATKHINTFYLTYSFSDLADYLSIDRSAMMREIKNLIDDGIIKKEKKKITLMQH